VFNKYYKIFSGHNKIWGEQRIEVCPRSYGPAMCGGKKHVNIIY